MIKGDMSKGGIYITRVEYVKEKYGTEGLKSLLGKMKEYGFEGKLDEKSIKIAEWYPQKYNILFLKAFKELFGMNAFKRLAKESPKATVDIVGLLLKWPSNPEELVKMANDYWHVFYNFGRLDGKMIHGGKAEIHGYEISEDPIFCEFLTYYFKGLVELIVKSPVKIEHTKCVHRGADHEVWVIEWGQGE